MKQLMTLMAISLLFADTATAHPLLHDKKPAKHKTNDNGRKEFQVLPNNKTGNATVCFKSDKSGKATIVVLNEDGTAVIKQAVKLTEGKNKIDISNFISLQEGYYTICLNTNYKSYSSPFLLWK